MGSPYQDLARPPLNAAALRRSLVAPSGLWSRLDVVEQIGSTNTALRSTARVGTDDGVILIAEEQVTGRGRLDRTWLAPARSAITLSVLLRPPSPPPTPWGWLPLLASLAVDDALRRFEVADSGIKWPNDVLIGERKVAGILCERVESPRGPAIVMGIGVNVSLSADELPTPAATSLAIAGEPTDREALVRALLRALEARYLQWTAGGNEELRRAYLERSVSIGRQVHVLLPGGRELSGTATGVDPSGGLIVEDDSGPHLVAAADVTHARLAD